MGTKRTNEEILEIALSEGNKWLEAFNKPEFRCKDTVLTELSNRTFEGEKVVAILVDKPSNVYEAALAKVKEVRAAEGKIVSSSDMSVLNNMSSCCWDYWSMAFYGSAATAAEISHPYTDESFFVAFKAGLASCVMLGGLVIGVMMPLVTKVNGEKNLHCEDGPAIVYEDEEHFWFNGVKVEREWIMEKETIDPRIFLDIENMEKRMAFCEIITWDRILSVLDATVIDKDWNPEIGTLLKVDLPDAPGEQFITAVCGTKRPVCLRVPKTMKTAIEAQAWMYNTTEEIVRMIEVRT